MDYAEFVKSLAKPHPVYLVVTDQAYLREKVQEVCLQQVPEAARAFDWSIHDLEEKQQTAQEVVLQVRTLPWLTPKRWVYVRNAALGEAELLPCLTSPSERTVLVLEVGKAPKSWPKLPKVEMEVGDKALGWIQKRVKSEGSEISSEAASLLFELVGDNLQALQSEIDKLLNWSLETRSIDTDDVLALVGEARQHKVWDLSEAMGFKDAEKALGLLNHLFHSGAEAPFIVASLYGSFKRLLVALERLDEGQDFFRVVKDLNLWSFRGRERLLRKFSKEFLKGMLLRIRDADRLLKSSGADPRYHLESLIVDTCR